MRSVRGTLLSCAVALALASTVNAQNFNIDLSTTAGADAPAPGLAYGAAAGQAGFWNNVTNPAAVNAPLNDLLNVATAVTISLDGGFMGSFTGPNEIATPAGSDAEKLIDDGWDPTGLTGIITISGLAAGQYSVYLYGVAPDSTTDLTEFGVVGSVEGGVVNVGGALANPFLDTYSVPVTHAIFTKNIVAGENLIINVGNRGGAFETVNGIQITPEPGSLGLLAVGALAMIKRRRN